MKKIISTLALILLLGNYNFAQTNNTTKPVKKVVTSKITKDPKTGKVVKTITTTTTTDIILQPGRLPAVANKNTAKPVIKKTTKPIKTQIVVSKSKTQIKKPVSQTKVIGSKPTQETQKTVIVVEKEDTGSIFSNPNDTSAKNTSIPVAEKPVVNTPYKNTTKPTNTNAQKTNNVSKAPTKVFTEKTISRNSYIGVRGGINLANTENAISETSIPTPTVSDKMGFNGGVFYNLGISQIISIQPELNYSQQGYKVTNGIDSDLLSNQAVNLPVLLKLTVGGPNLKFFVNGGPYVGYLLKSEKTISLKGQTLHSIIDFQTDANKEISVNRMDYGVQAGAGIQINLGGPKLELEGRYNYGIADPFNYSNTKPTYIADTGRNRIFTGTVGLLFPIGK